MNNPSPIVTICEYMLEFIVTKYEQAQGKMSPEVYDRAVSVIGTGVPMLLFCCALAVFVLTLLCLWQGVRKK